MALLNQNKEILLSQVKKNPSISTEKLIELIQTYDDLSIEDFQNYVSDNTLDDLRQHGRHIQEMKMWNDIQSAPRNVPSDIRNLISMLKQYIDQHAGSTHYEDALRLHDEMVDRLTTPEERESWKQIQSTPRTSPREVQDVQRLVLTFIQHFPNSNKLTEAQQMLTVLENELSQAIEEEKKLREQNDWDQIDRSNYSSLRLHLGKYPQTIHLDELDDLMWTITQSIITPTTLSRYISDRPEGKHVMEAKQALSIFSEWEEIKSSRDILKVDQYRSNNPDSPFLGEINSIYYTLKSNLLERMKKNPSEFGKDEVERYFSSGIFTMWELIDEGLMTEKSYESLYLDRSLFPNIQEFQVEDPNIRAQEGCTDVYLFGTPGTGKTCLLMGLTGANGDGITINMKAAGGPYASALQQYVSSGITPGRTFGKFVTTINGRVEEHIKDDRYVNHPINIVEMSGEEFALRIADGEEPSLENMGTGATNLLMNNNRKVFFIIVDSAKEKVQVDKVVQIKDENGDVVDEIIRKKYISQLDILNKFVSLFELPENQHVMKKVDAIHFVVTKSDLLDEDKSKRKEKARELLINSYKGPVEQLKSYCRQTKKINYSTDYKPQVFAFSLGEFYLGDVFEFDVEDTRNIIETIGTVTIGVKEKTWWEKFKEALN